MRTPFHVAKIVVFAAFIMAPVVSLVALGAVPPYGNAFDPFPTVAKVASQPEARASLGDAVLQRSIVKREAIRAFNALMYFGFGYIDTPQLVSGKSGWLFYKQDFWGGKCLSDGFFSAKLAQADVLSDMANAAGIRLILSVSPDKSAIYPDKFVSTARAYWNCEQKNSAAWRRIARKEAPELIDHAQPLRREKRAAPDLLLYFKTDTHWTPVGAALARRQLVQAIAGEKGGELPSVKISAGEQFTKPTDMKTGMLLLGGTETVPEVDPAIEAQVAKALVGIDLGKIVLLNDSFYAVYGAQVAAIFPGAKVVRFGSVPSDYANLLASADTIIVNSVERLFFGRLGGLAWSEELGSAILKRSHERAKGCTYGTLGGVADIVSSSGERALLPKVETLPVEDDGSFPISMPSLPSRGLPCIRLEVTAPASGKLQLFLPVKEGGRSRFERGRSIEVPLIAGQQEVQLVLPAYVAGRTIEIRHETGKPSIRVVGFSVGSLLGGKVD